MQENDHKQAPMDPHEAQTQLLKMVAGLEKVTTDVLKDTTKLQVLCQFAGGWEGWLQVELAYGLYKNRIFPLREQRYPGYGQADIVFNSLMTVELKCLGLRRPPDTFWTGVKSDVVKLKKCPTMFGSLVVIVPLFPGNTHDATPDIVAKIRSAGTFAIIPLDTTPGFLVAIHATKTRA